MNVLYAIILGAVQGLTEFLPISSTGHLIVIESLLGKGNLFGLLFNGMLHLGTLLSLIVIFRHKLRGILRSDKADTRALRNNIAIGTLPAIIVGLLGQNIIENQFQNPQLVAAALIIFSFVFIAAELRGREKANLSLRQAQGFTATMALLIGLAQSIAFVPGVSRSGITIAAGMLLGLRRAEALEFTFLLSIPIVAGAGGKLLFDALVAGQTNTAPVLLFIGAITSFVVGVGAIWFLQRFFASIRLYPFIVYRILLGLLLLA